jgi:hypothetical protein
VALASSCLEKKRPLHRIDFSLPVNACNYCLRFRAVLPEAADRAEWSARTKAAEGKG